MKKSSDMKSVLMLVSALLLGSCIGQPTKVDKSSARVVKSVEVRRYEQHSCKVEYPAKVESATDVNLSFRVAGILDRVVANEGEFVAKGEPLAHLDKRDYELKLEATQAEYDGVKSEVDRIIAMYEDKSVSENDYDKAMVGMRRITAKLKADKNALADATLVAPFDGYMGKRLFDRGEALAAGMPVVSFVSAAAPEVVINLPAADYMRRDALVAASAQVKLFPDIEFELKLISILPTANLNQLYAARFEVMTEDDILPPAGVTAMVTLHFDIEESDSVIVPFHSIVEQDGGSYVWSIEDGKVSAQRVDVVKILSSGEAIVEGELQSGDKIVAAGVSRLKEGDQVTTK